MILKKILLVLLLIGSMVSYAQDSIRIHGQLKNNSRFAKVVVQKYQVGTLNLTAVPIENEKFTITAPPHIEPGVYRLQYSQSSMYDYIEIIEQVVMNKYG